MKNVSIQMDIMDHRGKYVQRLKSGPSKTQQKYPSTGEAGKSHINFDKEL